MYNRKRTLKYFLLCFVSCKHHCSRDSFLRSPIPFAEMPFWFSVNTLENKGVIFQLWLSNGDFCLLVCLFVEIGSRATLKPGFVKTVGGFLQHFRTPARPPDSLFSMTVSWGLLHRVGRTKESKVQTCFILVGAGKGKKRGHEVKRQVALGFTSYVTELVQNGGRSRYHLNVET